MSLEVLGNKAYLGLAKPSEQGGGSITKEWFNWRTSEYMGVDAFTMPSPVISNSRGYDIAYKDGVYVALHYNGIGTSSDMYAGTYSTDNGDTWTPFKIQGASAQNYWSSIVEAEGKFFAINNYGEFASSVNGTDDWVSGTRIPSGTSYVNLIYGNGNLIAITSSGRISVSTDKGQSWSSLITVSSTGCYIAYGNNVFVALCPTNNGYYGVKTSADGLIWSDFHSGVSLYSPKAITFGNGVFIAISNSSAWYSFDGLYWSNELELPFPTGSGMINYSFSEKSLGFGNGVFLAVTKVSNKSYVLYTIDEGKTWTAEILNYPVSAAAVVVRFGDNKFVSVGNEPSCVFIDFTQDEIFTLTDSPDTSTEVYLRPNVPLASTIESASSASITLSNHITYYRFPNGDKTSPAGTLYITKNGTYDIREYATVIVNV